MHNKQQNNNVFKQMGKDTIYRKLTMRIPDVKLYLQGFGKENSKFLPFEKCIF